MKSDEATLILTIKVNYELGRTDVAHLERALIHAADHLAGEGLLSDDNTEASVKTWEAYVTQDKG